MQVSIILPTYNRLHRLRKVLRRLEQQDCGPDRFEVIVVSDGSEDGTDDYLQQVNTSLRLTFLTQKKQGINAARNRGVRRAAGDLLLFLDDDVVPTPQLVREHVTWHQAEEKDAVVIGPLLTPHNFSMPPWVEWEQRERQQQLAELYRKKLPLTARHFHASNTSIRQQPLLDAGSFDPDFVQAGEVELAFRLENQGLHFFFNPQAVAYHYADLGFQSWLALPYVNGRNQVIYTRDKGQQWLLPTILYEFRHQRSPLVRTLTQLCLDRPWLQKPVLALSKTAAQLGHLAGGSRLPHLAYNTVFSLRHYQGISDEMGGRATFMALAAQAGRKARELPRASLN